MPHGGYHGTVKVGGKTVQTGGGGYNPKGVSSSTPKRRILKTASEIPDNRERYIANQAQKAANQQAQFLINQANRRSDVETAMRFAPETVDRSDFTGFTGGVLGVRTGNFQDTGIPKLREGLTSDQYANYMRGLYSINPQRMETMFPVASGKAIRNVSRLMPGLGTLQNIAGAISGKTGDLIQGLKEIAMNKGIIPRDNLNDIGTTASDSSSTDTPGLDQNVDPNALQAPELAKFLSPQDMGFNSPLGRFVPNPQDMGITAQPGRFVKNPQDMNIQPKMSAQDYYKDLSPAELNFLLGGRNPAGMFGTDYAIPMNEGGLASINNPQYNMLMNASNFTV